MKNAFKTTLSALALLAVSAVSASAATFATQIDAGKAAAAGAGWDAITISDVNDRDEPGNALGAPNSLPGDDPSGFYSLGLGGVAVLGFGTSFDSTATVFEVTFGCAGPQTGDLCNFVETADVYAFNGAYTPFDGTFGIADLITLGFTQVGSIPNGLANAPGGAAISINGPFTYLALFDTSPSGAGRDGFDIDAVSVSAIPLPAGGLLLLTALGGVAALRRRKAV